MNKRPIKRSKGDVVHTLAKAVISGIPAVGGPAAELFSAVITPPLEKRRDEWLQSIVDQLTIIEEKIEGFRIEALNDNEIFISVLMHASQIVIRNHHKEKIDALRNSVINSAFINDTYENIHLIFINLIDQLTESHIILLKMRSDPEKYFQSAYEKYPDRVKTIYINKEYSTWVPVDLLLPGFSEKKSMYNHINHDLELKGLTVQHFGISVIHQDSTGEIVHILLKSGIEFPVIGLNQMRLPLSDFGKAFLNFIELPAINIPAMKDTV